MRNVILSLVTVILCGCASSSSPVLLKRADRSELSKQRSIRAFHGASKELVVRMPDNDMGPVGPAIPGAATPAELRKVIAKDPAMLVGEEFLSHLKTRHALASVPRDLAAALDDKSRAAGTPKDGAFLDFQVSEWSLGQAPHAALAYVISFRAQGRLVRTADGTTLWRASCQYPPQDEDGLRKTWDELTFDHGAGFKAMVEDAVRSCGNQLITVFTKNAD